jgi:hypothetical protein
MYGIGFAFDTDTLYFAIRTNFPETGAWGGDSYVSGTVLSPGDLRINAGGNLFGLAVSTHGNVVQQAYSGTWPTVTKGRLYSNPTFATGTYEEYELELLARGVTPYPSDGSPANVNSYPTLIMGFTAELTGVSNVQYSVEYDPLTPWMYEVTGSIKKAALGLDYGEYFDLFWSQECGNDGVFIAGNAPPVPEPSTMLLLSAGLLGLGLKRRRGKTA